MKEYKDQFMEDINADFGMAVGIMCGCAALFFDLFSVYVMCSGGIQYLKDNFFSEGAGMIIIPAILLIHVISFFGIKQYVKYQNRKN